MQTADTALTKSLWEIYMPDGTAEDTHQARALKLALREAWLAAVERWPSFSTYKASFVERVAAIAGTEEEANTKIDQLHAEDLFLATAALEGCQEALIQLEAQIRNGIRPVLIKHLRSDEVLITEVAQCTVVDVLYGRTEGRRPKLASYSATGRLTAWLNTVAANTARDHIRRLTELSPSTMKELIADDGDPHMLHILETYASQVAVAISRAMDQLPANHRTVLRMALVEDMTIDEIGQFYGKNRATAARWINKAKDAVVSSTRDEFCLATGATPTEFSSLLRALAGYLDVSLERRLRDQAGADGGSASQTEA